MGGKELKNCWGGECYAMRITRTSGRYKSNLCIVFIVYCVLRAAVSIHYEAPDDCEWKMAHPDSQDVYVTCHIPVISTSARRTNFSLIQTEYTLSLSVICDRVFFESHLENGTLSHLTSLKILKITYCKLPTVVQGTFHGLVDLREISIRTFNTDWGSLFLEIEDGVFSEQTHLEVLDLAYNNIGSLPLTLCGLHSLKVLNLTHNQLDDISSFRQGNESAEPCLEELLKLDLSFNVLTKVGEADVKFPNIRVLNLSNNKIKSIDNSSLEHLRKLQVVDLSNNFLTAISKDLFIKTSDVKEIYLGNNSLRALPPSCFGGLQQLQILNLSHNGLTNEHIVQETFSDLIRLVVLDLGYNSLQRINSSIFQSQYSLQKLLLDHNQIHLVSDNTFSALYNLHTLDLSHNKLTSLDAFTMNGLYVLSILNLQNNLIEGIHHGCFKNCSSVQSLNLSGNRFTEVPSAIGSLHFLLTLDLSNNVITDINNSSFQSVRLLHNINLSHNDVGNLTRGVFRDTPSLRHIDLSHNRIHNLGHGMFDDAMDILYIALNDNLLTDINGLFMNLHNLETLNISRNKITWFDYALVATELKTLDLHDNELDNLGNYYELVPTLKYLDLSYNALTSLNAASFPHSVAILRLNNNHITSISPLTFMPKTNLTAADLSNNKIRKLDMSTFRLSTVEEGMPLPLFYIAGNPLHCDCTMEWLQRINQLDNTRQYPKIVDVDKIMCEFPFSRHHSSLPLSKANSSDFLCNYKSHCFALCHCCEFDACDCEMVCPENCTCYSDQTWNTNAVECTNGNYTTIPARIPMDVTELYLDGNNITQLTSHTFIGRKNMRSIYLNSSNIHTINNRTFNGLVNLKILHLSHNKLTIFHGFEFETLVNLRELYLNHNEIYTITNITFVPLKSLEVLHLQFNHISEYHVWILTLNRRLSDVRLSHNAWSCKCPFMEDFFDWLLTSGSKVKDADATRCSSNHTSGFLVRFFNTSQVCSNRSSVTYFQAAFVEDYMPVMITAPSVFLLVVFVLVVICIYRKDMKVWFFSKYGVRLFHRSQCTPENEKLFDAFVSYCKKDEAFVAQILAPELECGSPPYRLCLRYRDLPSAGYIAEAITEAIECSHRTIVVLSDQFLKSEWCRFELKTAHHESQRNSKHRLIVVLLDRISFKDMDSDAKLCFQSSPIVRWGDKRFWEKLRYSLPEGRVTEPKNCHQYPSPSNSVKLV